MRSITAYPDMRIPLPEYTALCIAMYHYVHGERALQVESIFGMQTVILCAETEYNGPACDLIMTEHTCDVCLSEDPDENRCDCTSYYEIHGYLTSDPVKGLMFVADTSYIQEISRYVLKAWERRFGLNKH